MPNIHQSPATQTDTATAPAQSLAAILSEYNNKKKIYNAHIVKHYAWIGGAGHDMEV